MRRLIVIAGIALLGLILLSACSDDAEPTSEQVAVPTTVSQDQASPTPETQPIPTTAPAPTPTAAPEPTATATVAPTPRPTAAPEATATATVAPTPTPTAAPEPTATATMEPIPAPGESVSIALDELNASGQSGTATLTAIGDTTVVELTLSTGSLETELVHIHAGQCGDSLGGVAHGLTSFVGGSGASVTTVEATLDSLLTGGFAINAHQSGNPGTYTACGNIPAKGQPVSIALDELNASGQVGTATLTAIGDTTLVELSLAAGALETQLVHIHVGQCGATLADVAHVLTNFVGGSGASATTVDVVLDSLLTGGFAVNAHQSGNPGVYTACGNIPGTDVTSVQASVEANIEQFVLVNLTIAVGTTVRWTNLDQSTHTVTLGSDGSSTGGFDSANLRRDATFEFTFDTPGAFAYTCRIHPWMNGTITVEGAATAATENPLY